MWGTASLASAPGGFSFGPFTPVPQTQFVPFQTADPAGHGVGYIHHVTATTAQSCEEIRWQFYSQSKSSPAPIAPFGLVESEAKPDFRKEIGSLLEDTTFADVTFVLEGEEVKAHRNVLAARSPTFKAMFTSGLSESASGAVIKLDGKNSTFRAMLQYIYSEQVSISDVDAAIDLLAMAEEYFLPGLKTECADVLVGQYLTEDTAVSLFQVANLFRAPALKEKCADFILRNTATVNLADFGKDMLAELVLVACSTKPPAVPLGASGFGPAATPRGAAFPAPPTNPFAAPAPATPACPATFG